MYTGFTIDTSLMLSINKWTRPGTKIIPKGLAIHWTGNINKGANARSTANFFKGRSGTFGSAHYSLDDGKVIYQSMPENELAYHVGANKYYTTKFGSYPNNKLIGIEVSVNMGADFKKTYDNAVRFAAQICKKYGWDPHDRIVRHYDVTRKDCPLHMTNLVFDAAHVRRSVESQMSWAKKQGTAYFNQMVEAGVHHIKNNLQIDGVQGEALWKKFLDDVKDEIDGTRLKKKVVQIMSKHFADLGGHWAENTLDDLHEKGLYAGSQNPNGGKPLARPDDNITRAEAGTLISRAVDYVLKEMK